MRMPGVPRSWLVVKVCRVFLTESAVTPVCRHLKPVLERPRADIVTAPDSFTLATVAAWNRPALSECRCVKCTRVQWLHLGKQ